MIVTFFLRGEPPSPYIIYGPHGYRTFAHSRCQEVPTAESVPAADIEARPNYPA